MRSPWVFPVSASLLLVAAHGAAAPPSPAAAAPASAPAAAPASLPAAAPLADPVVASGEIVDQIQAASTGVRHQLRTARAHRDVIKIICLNDKLNQLDVAARSARDRREALVAAQVRGDADLVTHERVRLEALREQGRRVAAEAGQCLGSPELVETQRDHTSATSPPLPEPSDYPGPDVIVVQPLPASAIK